MKKNLIITLVLGLFLVSCKNNNIQPDASSDSGAKLSSQPSQADITCTTYSIFNPRGPSGATVLYTYNDCNGESQSGSVEPQQTVSILAQQGTVKCPGGVVTETGGKRDAKISAQLSQPEFACISYSIFNPHGQLGPTVLYTYNDCSGESQSGSVDPQQTVIILAQEGTVKCPGGVVTQSGISPKTEPARTKP